MNIEQRKKISESLKGNHNKLNKPTSEETRKKISESLKGNHNKLGKKGQIAWNKNKTGIYSEETIKKISIGGQGNKNRVGKKHTEEAKIKNSEAHKGILFSEERKQKHRDGHNNEITREKHKQARLKQKFPKKDSKGEKLLQQELLLRKIPFITQYPTDGQPDIFIEPNIFIFADGCFHHKCPLHYVLPKTNIEYWKKQADDRFKKDIEITQLLKDRGYIVYRFWWHDIKKDVKECVDRILELKK